MSKLRSDELVNMEGDGAPSFPQGATSIEPTTDNQVATKLYVDSALSAAAGNAVSSTAPTNPAIGSFWTDTSVSPSLLKTWNGSMWIEFAGTAAAAVGVVVSLPSLSATNLEYAPATITAAAAQVSNATLFTAKWYKDDVEIPGATGSTYVATEPGVYRYEERWADNAGNVLTPSLNKTIQVLAIATPSITSPVVDTGVPDFVYTAASSAIANINTVDALSNEDAFSVYLQSSTSNQPLNIDNGLDFATHGGLIWLKSRNGSGIYNSNVFIDTERGADTALFSDSTNANSVLTGAPYSSSFDSDGFTWGSEDNFHPSGRNYASWSFLQSPGFFDVVTYTGSGVTRTVPHNLGSAPGMIIIKGSNISGSNWAVYHKELDVNDVAFLNYTSQASEDVSNRFAGVHPTSTEFTVGTSQDTNYTGSEYVAYVFADNPSNEIKCGTFSNNTGNWGTPASEDATVDCGFEPQFVIAKLATAGSTTQAGGWYVMDSTRGWGSGMYNQSIQTNETNAETADTNFNFTPTSTGFIVTYSSPGDHIYLAIGSPKISVSNTQLTLTDTTVSKISDGSLISGTTIDQVLTVGETVQAVGIENYWITTLEHSSSEPSSVRGIAFDNSGGIYVAGQEQSVDNAAYVAKFNGTGSIEWQKSLNHHGANEEAQDVAVDSLNNVYFCGYSQKAGNNGGIVVKYNNSGTLQWQRLLSSTIGSVLRGLALATDSSDNVIAVGYAPIQISGNQTSGVLIAKYNSSGVLQWARTLNQEGTSNRNEYGYGVAVDSLDNIYVCGEAGNSSYGSTDCLIAKYDSSGNIQWQKLLGDQYSATEDRFRGITVDSSDNIYVVGHSQKHTNNDDTIIAKYDTSGNLVWQKYIQNGAKGRSIDTDSSGNVYVLSENLRDVGEGGSDFYIAKFDSSGNVEWQRALGGANNDESFSLRLDPSDNLYIGGTTRSPSSNTYTQGLLFKIPTDGSMVGTYGGLTYQSVSLNAGSSTLQDRIADFRDSAADSSGGGDNSQVNDSESTLTDEFDPGYTANVTTIAGVLGTVSASSGNTITLSNTSGTWSTGMKVQGVTTDTKDNPDLIDASAVTFTSSEPATTSGTVSAWDYAEWNLSHDSTFSGVVHQKAVPLTATGTQTGPDDFTIQPGTEYFVRTKYASSLPTGQSDWSAVTRFLTKQPGGWTAIPTQDVLSNPSGQNQVTKVIKDGDDYIIFGYSGTIAGWIRKTTDFQTFEPLASELSLAMNILSACSFGPGKYIVVGRPTSGNAWNCVFTTTNGGASWNLYPLNNGNLGTIYSPYPSIKDIAWDGANSFCMVIGNNVNENQYTHIWISNDLGQTFNHVNEPSPQYCSWEKVTFFDGKFVLFGGRTAQESGTWTQRPRIAYSTNSNYSSWSNATFPESDEIRRTFKDFFVYNNKLYTAPTSPYGGSITMIESTDGMTFTSVGGQNSQFAYNAYNFASDDETIVMRGYANSVLTTQDLNLPFQSYTDTAVGTMGLEYIGDRFIAYHYDDSDHTKPLFSYNYTGFES
jgi:hypothetical protein